MVMFIIIAVIILFSVFILGYWLGHVHYNKHIMKYKLSEFIFYELTKVDENCQSQILDVLRGINEDGIEL